MDYQTLDDALSEGHARILDRAVAILWLARAVHGIEGMTAADIVKILETDCGHPKQNVSRLHGGLQSDNRTAKHGKDGFRLRPEAFRTLETAHAHRLTLPRKSKMSSGRALIPLEIFSLAGRAYLTRIVEQVNGCNEYGFFDGVMVLSRRLLETLTIEVYQQVGRASEIKKGADGSFLAFDDLVGKISADTALHISRETRKALASVKKYGDQSAHNPKFTARTSDVDEIRQGLRIAAEELLNLCHFK